MRHNLAIKARFAAAMAVLLLVAAPCWADPPGQEKAQKLVDGQKTVIARFMHPAASLDKIACTTTRTSATGEFYMVYVFTFNGEHSSSLRFHFFEDGSLDTIEVAGTSFWIKPFQAIDMVVAAMLQLVAAPGAHRLTNCQASGTAKTALEFWLRLR